MFNESRFSFKPCFFKENGGSVLLYAEIPLYTSRPRRQA